MYCTRCGLCCMQFSYIDLPEEYKKLDDGTGKCIYLVNNMCSIYEVRPLLCNHEKLFELYYKDLFDSIYDYEEYLHKQCKKIQRR